MRKPVEWMPLVHLCEKMCWASFGPSRLWVNFANAICGSLAFAQFAHVLHMWCNMWVNFAKPFVDHLHLHRHVQVLYLWRNMHFFTVWVNFGKPFGWPHTLTLQHAILVLFIYLFNYFWQLSWSTPIWAKLMIISERVVADQWSETMLAHHFPIFLWVVK